MPRYYLNIEHDDGTAVLDEQGADFTDLDAALAEARLVAIELVAEAMRDQQVRSPSRIVVADPTGAHIGDVSAGSVLPPSLRRQ